VATARADGSPLLCVAAHGDGEGAGCGLSLLAPAATASFAAATPDTAPQTLRAGLARMLAAPRGPVLFSLPPEPGGEGAAGDFATWQPLDAAAYRPRFVDAVAVERLWRILVPDGGGSTPARVAVLAGAGVEKAGAVRRLIAFAEQFELPVATTVRGKGAFPGDHRLCLGVCDGPGRAAGALLTQPLDVLILLGCNLSGGDGPAGTAFPAPGRILVQVDADPAAIGRAFPVDVPVVGDCRAALELMLEGGSARINRLRAGNQARAAWARALRKAAPPEGSAGAPAAPDAPPDPLAVAAALRRALPRDGCLVVDALAQRPFFTHGFTAVRPCAYFTPAPCAPAGWAVAAAVGVKAAVGPRAVACVTDARGLLALGTELATAARCGLPVLVVALVAEGAGAVPDFAALGRALGARGLCVSRADALGAALLEGLSGDGPCVAAVRCGPGASPGAAAVPAPDALA
jgi:acetolactate synthase-1/2/3 large subunit